MRRNYVHHRKLIGRTRHAAKKTSWHRCGTIEIDLIKNRDKIVGRVVQNADIHTRCDVRHYLIGIRTLPLRIDLSRFKRLPALFERKINRRKIIERNTEHTKNRVNMLHHAAALRANCHAFADHVPDQTQGAVVADNKKHRARIHRRNVPDRYLVFERRISAIGAPDPVRCHETKVDQI